MVLNLIKLNSIQWNGMEFSPKTSADISSDSQQLQVLVKDHLYA